MITIRSVVENLKMNSLAADDTSKGKIRVAPKCYNYVP
jgi:hypothetical protein